MGDTDLSRQFEADSDRYRLRAGLVYGHSVSDRFFAGSDEVANDHAFRLDLDLFTLTAGCELPTGTGLGLALPMGRIRRRDDINRDHFIRNSKETGATPEQTQDTGLGDLEVRLRQDLGGIIAFAKAWPRVLVSLGAALPTGPYIEKSNIVTTGDGYVAPDQYASLGRGVAWLLADVEILGALGERWGWYASLWTRTALNQATNGFAWGPERRTSLGVSFRAVPGLLTLALNGDWQWRDTSTELLYDPAVERKVRTDFISGGGDWYDLVPTIRADWTEYVSSTLTARIPIHRDVHGLQGVQNVGLFLGVQWSFSSGASEQSGAVPGRSVPAPSQPGSRPEQPEIARLLVPGRITLVDYWATWCAPCAKLDRALTAFHQDRPDLAIVRVDASEWQQPEMDRLLPAVPGLPVLDIYGADGRLVARLVGPACFDFAKHLPPPPVPPVPAATDANSVVTERPAE